MGARRARVVAGAGADADSDGESVMKRTTRVLAHAHSTWSHDGHLPLDAYHALAPRLDATVVLLTEHEETGWTAERYDHYVRVCASLSTPAVRLIPGIEFNQQGYHLLCYGLRAFPHRPSSITDL